MPKLSVITVTYNCIETIEKTLLSVARQDYDSFEHIVIDGGSNDGTVDVIKKYKDNISCFISEPDRGIYDAMNKGINRASGDWILFLNSGDVFFDNFDLSFIKWAWPLSAKFIFFSYIIDGAEAPIVPNLKMRFGLPTSHQAMFTSSCILKKYKFNLGYKVASDYEFFLKQSKFFDDCIFLEDCIISHVLPGGYSALHYKRLKSEYFKIIYNNIGVKGALLYLFFNNQNLYRCIKNILPLKIFNFLKRVL